MVRLIILRLLESYFRHRWLYLVPIGALAVIGLIFASSKDPEYLSIGTVYVDKDTLITSLTGGGEGGSWWVTPAQQVANEINEMMRTDSFVRSAIQSTDLERFMDEGPIVVGETIDEFRQSISIEAAGDNLVLFRATNKNPRVAQQIAASTLEAFIQWKLNSDRKDSANALEFFEKVGNPYQLELKRAKENLQSFLAVHPEPVRGERPETEQQALIELEFAVDQAQDKVYELMENKESAQLAQTRAEAQIRQNYALIDAPQLPVRPIAGMRAKLMLVIPFVGVGVFLTVAGIIGAAVLDRSLLFPIDVRHGLELPVLAMVPNSRVSKKQRRNDFVIQINMGNRPGQRPPALPAPGKNMMPVRQPSQLSRVRENVVQSASAGSTVTIDALPPMADQTTGVSQPRGKE